jgi:hypothetical protein
MTGDVMIVNTSTTIGLPDGQLTVSEESITRAVSGVYGLNWFPTGPDVLARLLGWLGFTEVRVNWWRRMPGQKPGHARLELVTSRNASALARFDAAEQQLPPLSRIVEKAVPPQATVLVASPPDSGPVAFDGRHARPFPAGDANSRDDSALIAELVKLRGEGAGYFLIPHAATSWIGDRPDLQRHLHWTYKRIAREPDVGVLFSLLLLNTRRNAARG